MSKKDEALKLAMDYLLSKQIGAHIIAALREALAEQQGFVSPGGGYVPAIPAQQALNKMAENARELGLDYEPSAGTQVSKVWWDGDKMMAKQVPLEDFYKPAQHRAWFTVDELNAWADKKLKENPQWAEQPAQQEPEFFTHCVDQPYDWSEWVCPDPKGYLMKCCDCGLVHEAEFGVVRYKSETEREDCDMVDDPNLQAVFRMRRSEQWSPADMAHRAGGLTMEQPAQQWCSCEPTECKGVGRCRWQAMSYSPLDKPAQQGPVWDASAPLVMTPHPAFARRTWVGLTDEEIEQGCKESWVTEQAWQSAVWWAEAKLKEKNT